MKYLFTILLLTITANAAMPLGNARTNTVFLEPGDGISNATQVVMKGTNVGEIIKRATIRMDSDTEGIDICGGTLPGSSQGGHIRLSGNNTGSDFNGSIELASGTTGFIKFGGAMGYYLTRHFGGDWFFEGTGQSFSNATHYYLNYSLLAGGPTVEVSPILIQSNGVALGSFGSERQMKTISVGRGLLPSVDAINSFKWNILIDSTVVSTNGHTHDASAITNAPWLTTNAPAWIAQTNTALSITLTNDLERPQFLFATGAVSLAFSGLRPPQPIYLIVKGPSSVTFPAGTHFVGGASWQTNAANHFIVWQFGTNVFVNPTTTSEF